MKNTTTNKRERTMAKGEKEKYLVEGIKHARPQDVLQQKKKELQGGEKASTPRRKERERQLQEEKKRASMHGRKRASTLRKEKAQWPGGERM